MMKWNTTIMLLAVSALAATSASAKCVKFEGIVHCPKNDAALSLNADGSRLRVAGLGSAGDDGVIAQFAPATFWQASYSLPATEIGDEMHLTAVAQGFPNAHLDLQARADGLEGRVRFTGASEGGGYRVVLFDGGKIEKEIEIDCIPGNCDDDEDGPIDPGPDPDPPSGPGLPELTFEILEELDSGISEGIFPEMISFGVETDGGCTWGTAFDDRVEVVVEGISLGIGDELKIYEAVGGQGHYTYVEFEKIVVESTQRRMVITDELVSTN